MDRCAAFALDAERRSILPIQILMRWTLVATALLIIVWEPRSSGASYIGLVAIVVGAAALNAWMHWRLARGEPIAVGLPTLAGVYDAVAITAGLRIVEGFDNLNFALYYPALLALTIVFPGRWSLLYAGATMAAHSVLVTTHSSFDWGSSQDVKDLGVRLITVAVVVAIANLAVSIERRLRARAVGAAVAAHAERQRVSREIHDGVAQGVYMLAVNLEANTKVIERQTDDEALQQRMRALVRLSKQTLLETRGLLIDMGPAFAGEEGLAACSSTTPASSPPSPASPSASRPAAATRSCLPRPSASSTACSRKASRTSTSTPMLTRPNCASLTPLAPLRSRSSTTAAASSRASSTGPATASRTFGSGPSCSVGSWSSSRRRVVAPGWR